VTVGPQAIIGLHAVDDLTEEGEKLSNEPQGRMLDVPPAGAVSQSVAMSGPAAVLRLCGLLFDEDGDDEDDEDEKGSLTLRLERNLDELPEFDGFSVAVAGLYRTLGRFQHGAVEVAWAAPAFAADSTPRLHQSRLRGPLSHNEHASVNAGNCCLQGDGRYELVFPPTL